MENVFRISSSFNNKLYFSLWFQLLPFVPLNMKSFIFVFFCIFYFDFYCFHYLNRSYVWTIRPCFFFKKCEFSIYLLRDRQIYGQSVTTACTGMISTIVRQIPTGKMTTISVSSAKVTMKMVKLSNISVIILWFTFTQILNEKKKVLDF